VTVPKLVSTIESAGGLLMLRGGRIRYQLPESVAPLLDDLRTHRDEVIRVLRERQRPAQASGRCYVHGTEAQWWKRGEVCALCHPDPDESALRRRKGRGSTPSTYIERAAMERTPIYWSPSGAAAGNAIPPKRLLPRRLR
jgi:hypothetical protein